MSASKRLLKFLGYILDYVPIIATVLLATIASFVATRDKPLPQELLQWTLAVLALMATTQLIDRFRILRSIDGKIEKLTQSKQDDVSANDFFRMSFPNLEERLKQAKSISISGVSLARTSVSLWSVLQERINHKVPVKILVVDPEHSIVEVAAFRLNRHQDPVRLRNEIKNALGNFESLHEKNTKNNKLFQLRLIPFVPSYGIWIIDGGTEKAEIWIEVYAFRGDIEPVFQLLPHRDLEWFSHFEQQFENMWDASRVWEPSKGRSSLTSIG